MSTRVVRLKPAGIKICESEASETLYWLEIVNDLQWATEADTNPLIEECSELLAIYSAIGRNLNMDIRIIDDFSKNPMR